MMRAMRSYRITIVYLFACAWLLTSTTLSENSDLPTPVAAVGLLVVPALPDTRSLLDRVPGRRVVPA
jgi:hypothetical protein